MKSKAWKDLSKRADKLYLALCGLEKLPTNELKALQAVCRRVSQTNCSWLAFLLAPVLDREITGEFMRRKAKRGDQQKGAQQRSDV